MKKAFDITFRLEIDMDKIDPEMRDQVKPETFIAEMTSMNGEGITVSNPSAVEVK